MGLPLGSAQTAGRGVRGRGVGGGAQSFKALAEGLLQHQLTPLTGDVPKLTFPPSVSGHERLGTPTVDGRNSHFAT